MPVPKLDNAPRCQHTKLSGEPCRCPAIRGRQFCHFHDTLDRKRGVYDLPWIEDATSLQFAVMQVIRALIDKEMDAKTASLVLYGLQIACSNLKRFDLERPSSEVSEKEDDASLAMLLINEFSKKAPKAVDSLRARHQAQNFPMNCADDQLET